METTQVFPVIQPTQLKPLIVALSPRSDAALANFTADLSEQERNAPPLVEMGRTAEVSVAGRLRLADGRPAAYIAVRYGRQRTTTNADGIYVFFDLPSQDQAKGRAKDHMIVAELPGYGDVTVPAFSGSRLEGRAAPTLVLPALISPVREA